ncbi:YceI family protein [Oleiagrimonas sp. C23AA]|uniref:YceI family protein n=1 Tax=Oleiagrimonas sp. C23AA TaxID=2719047 RepID=UPI00141FEBCE|nr:YceI family protein [Oleiagrimonas sp. C23AA]NII12298.1 polyisoprenoid-binding protein [Oleiagrimonas sp. C23AA]
MRVRSLFAVAALALAPVAAFAAPKTYTLDPGHTQVMFSWNHFGFSNPTANFNTVKGTLVYDAADPAKSHVQVTMPMSSLDTHVPALDEHLKGADFFNAAKYPDVTFKSTKVIPEGDQKLKVIGNLTAHGVTHPVTLQVTLNKMGMHPMMKVPAIGFDATATLERKDFGVGAYVPMVSNQIKVRITVEADAKGAK